MIKKVLLSVFLVLVVSILGGYFYFKDAFKAPINVCSVTGEAHQVPIYWSKNKNSDRQAMFIPVFLEGITDTLYMQFDLGAVNSALYKKPVLSLMENYPNWGFKNGKEFGLKIQGMQVNYDSIKVFNFGESIDFSRKDKKIIIGTIGTDLLEKTKAIIDFQNSHISFSKHPIDAFSNRKLSKFEFKERRIMIPAVFEGQHKTFMWDTGSSAYSFITSEGNFHKLRNPAQPVREEKSNQKTRKLTVYTAPTQLNLGIGDKALEVGSVTYVDGFPWYIEMMYGLSGMEGMLGNNVFKNERIYLDCQNEELLIL